ncbi:glycoside hydrolase domain-containing protein [Kitasatospora viridis]|uniref:Uncharacterized protein DUF1906 n=1 Tax=Kitasatospora viridis TaxID=281105 RepID=A0A561UC42_9ACTN|nr:glycoside hydrolase domain-containing protein [Kitasatospora viridis]TWF96937.1 uncharacterized protein DUF1906 [Kitasatospora viridis]
MPAHAPSSTTRRTLAALALATTLSTASVGIAQAAPATTTDKAVNYLGYTFRVPANWPVVSLAAHPDTCVRYDQHAVYLGTPGADQACPAHVGDRTEALLVEPVGSAADPSTVDQAVAHQFLATGKRARVTGTYGTDKAVVQRILAGAGLPGATAPAAHQTAVGKAAAEQSATVRPAAAMDGNTAAYTGYGFDTCAAPSSSTMSSWLTNSPYRAVGIYIGGANRGCSQPNLTASWVQQQASAGWHFMPLYVGLQASAISSPGTDGAAAADDAIAQAQSLGFGQGTPLYYDMEQYAPGYSSNVLGFLAAWTNELHAKGYKSAVYSSSSSGIKDLAANLNTGYNEPDVVFDANWNNTADTNDSVLPAGAWSNHQRVHQYSGNATQTYGGVTLGVDQDYLDVAVTTSPWANTVHLVNATPDGGLNNAEGNYTAGVWTGWSNLGASGVKAVTSAATGSVNRVFILGGDNNIYENDGNYASGTWSGWRQLIGAPQATAITASASGDTVHLDAVEADGHVYNSDGNFDTGQWNGWSSLGGANMVRIASATTANNVNHIFAIDTSNQLWEIDGNYAAGTWNTWSNSANFKGTDVTASAGGDTVHLGAIGTDGNWYNNDGNFDTGSWQGWSNGGTDGAGPLKRIASAMANNVNHVFAVNANNRLIEKDGDYNAGTWNTWQAPAGGADSIGVTASFTS